MSDPVWPQGEQFALLYKSSSSVSSLSWFNDDCEWDRPCLYFHEFTNLMWTRSLKWFRSREPAPRIQLLVTCLSCSLKLNCRMKIKCEIWQGLQNLFVQNKLLTPWVHGAQRDYCRGLNLMKCMTGASAVQRFTTCVQSAQSGSRVTL